MRLSLTSVAFSTLFSFPAVAADVSCAMTSECFMGEACNETTFDFSIEGRDKTTFLDTTGTIQMDVAISRLVTDAETVVGVVGTTKDQIDLFPLTFYSLPAGATHMVSIAANGAAQYTMLMPDSEFAATYAGTCEGTTKGAN